MVIRSDLEDVLGAQVFRVVREAVEDISALNICSGFVGGSVQVGYNLDRPELFPTLLRKRGARLESAAPLL